MRLHMRWQGVAAAALLALAVTGCPKENAGGNAAPSGGAPAGTSAGSAGGTGGGAATGSIKIAVIPKGTQHSFWQTVKAGADAAAAEEQVTINWVGPQKENDITDQHEVIRNQVAAGVNALVVAATDSTA